LKQGLGLRRRHRHRRARPLQAVDGLDHHEERERNDQELEHRLNERAVFEEHRQTFGTGADLHREIREVDAADRKPDRRHDDVRDQGIHDLAEGAADHDADSEVDDAALHREFFEFRCHSHVRLPLQQLNFAGA